MALATVPSVTDPRELALLKAVGLDRAAPEQRELALNIASRYDLDLLLKHMVLIEGRPYITRDGLLHVAHRSGVLDGMETSEPTLDGEHWRASCSVYRKDMSRPFTYTGRYPAKGGNAKYAPEMAVKVAEVMALRRAFDVAAPAAEERWDLEAAPLAPAAPQPSLAERAAAKRAEIEQPAETPINATRPGEEADREEVEEAVVREEDIAPAAPSSNGFCGAESPLDGAKCGIAADVNHSIHREIRDGRAVQTWPAGN
jgi:hypothetical protein